MGPSCVGAAAPSPTTAWSNWGRVASGTRANSLRVAGLNTGRVCAALSLRPSIVIQYSVSNFVMKRLLSELGAQDGIKDVPVLSMKTV